MAKREMPRTQFNEDAKDIIAEEVTEDTIGTVSGKVFNCVKLNIREEANINSKSIGVLAEGTEVQVVEDESTDAFYKVIAPTGMEGYCMKNFVAVSV